MNVNFNVGQANNVSIANRINQSLPKGDSELKKGIKLEQKDSVQISPMGRKSSAIESFIKQKQSIMEQREKLTTSTIEKGGTLDSIKTQLESFDEQLKNIDQQIAKEMAEQAKKQAEEKKTELYSKPKTREEVENESFTNLISNSSDLKHAKIVNSVKNKVEAETRMLKAEIKSGYGNIESKKAQVSELDQKTSNLASQVNERLAGLNENIKDGDKAQNVIQDTTSKKDDQ